MNIRTLALALAIMPAIASAQDNNSDKDTISNKNTLTPLLSSTNRSTK